MEELNWSCLPEDEPGAEPADGISSHAVVPRDTEHPPEVRTCADLRSESRSRLTAALTRLAADTATTGVATVEIADALRHHEAHTHDPHDIIFRGSLTTLKTWLDEYEERDAGAREQVEVKRQEREDEQTYLHDLVEESRQALAETQESIKERVHSTLERISNQLNVLHTRDGYAADLLYNVSARRGPVDLPCRAPVAPCWPTMRPPTPPRRSCSPSTSSWLPCWLRPTRGAASSSP
ncbi:hypothetical protein AB0M28_20610 [Streptomyces sp. NPDC051940]|uniref:hypothetical protein n=1 Tax=Streptomyces sp. NPDC051940 TaxID=3155675 RepID=UPI003436AC94